MARILILLNCAILLLVLLSPAVAESEAVPRVLILHSYHSPYVWTDRIMDGMMSILRLADDKIDIYTEYLDAQRIPKQASWPAFEHCLKVKYAGEKFDVILASDDDMLDFLIPRYEALFPDTPVVFCGINNLDESRFEKHRAFKGVNQEIDAKGTILLALKLLPDTEKILVISDRTSGGIKTTQKFKNDIQEMGTLKQKFQLMDDYTLPALKKRLQALGPNDLVLVLRIQKIKGIDERSPARFAKIVTDTAPVPAFKLWDIGESDFVGGVLVSPFEQGKTAAEIALRILKGEGFRNIPRVTGSPNVSMLNYAVMKKFNINLKNIPDGTTITDRPISILEEYSGLARLVLFIFVVMALVVLSLVIILFQRRKSEKLILESKRKLFESEKNIALLLKIKTNWWLNSTIIREFCM